MRMNSNVPVAVSGSAHPPRPVTASLQGDMSKWEVNLFPGERQPPKRAVDADKLLPNRVGCDRGTGHHGENLEVCARGVNEIRGPRIERESICPPISCLYRN